MSTNLMTLPAKLKHQIESKLQGRLVSLRPLAGGSISRAFALKTGSGTSYFLKWGEQTSGDMFRAEAHGLEAIAATQSIATPAVKAVGDTFLLLELIATSAHDKQYWQILGRNLAALHNHKRDLFGFDQDNYCGSTPQPNGWYEDGYQFFAEERLLYQARLAYDRHLLEREDVIAVERLCNRLPELIPRQRPALIHGDLWAGNHLCRADGHPVLIDPACHYGWAEAELAMTTLFGGFDDAFYQSYLECHPCEQGWRERCPIYNLYHLLNHLNLFQGGYLQQVRSVLHHFA